MNVEKIAITRKFNLGNYQTMDIHAEASVQTLEDPEEALRVLEQIINDYWTGRTNALVSMARKEAGA